MSKVIAVIGGGYGDEGKGLMTDYFSSQYDDAIVIRSNGGAQAGHTVVRQNGDRHVFSHFGSGTFNGAPTYLSKHFVCNPILFVKEYKLLTTKFNITPKVYIDPACLISTPYDMLINQSLEVLRNDDIHGSCGIGFGETFERKLLYPDSTITMQLADFLYDSDGFGGEGFFKTFDIILDDIRKNYISKRMNIHTLNKEFQDIIMSDDRMAAFNSSLMFMLKHTTLSEAGCFADNTLIFEGAQGLQLDMDYGHFPYVTRSNCGMKNVTDILSDIEGDHDITVNYVRRAYTTRHGAGPLDKEMSQEDMGHDIVDETNIPNDFQGSLRFADANFDLFESITNKDFLNYAPRGSKKTVTTTCMDQLGEEVGIIEGYSTVNFSNERFTEIATYDSDFLSYGPTIADIRVIDK